MSNDDLTIDRPIEGDISHYSGRNRVEQGTAAEFLEALDAVLNIEGVDSVRWDQYTPYFNDGEPCEFGVNERGVKFTDGDDAAGDYEDGYIGIWSLTFERTPGVFPYRPEDVSVEQVQAIAAAELSLARFEDVLRENFGDPAEVTATKDGFNVEYYDHE